MIALILAGMVCATRPLAGEEIEDPRLGPPVELEKAVAETSTHDIVCELFPATRIWDAPIANQREPRMYLKPTSLEGQAVTDVAVGMALALGRIGPGDEPRQGLQLDLIAGVFTRFDDQGDQLTTDYRVGTPLTMGFGDWQFKFGYEHTSCHLSDTYLAPWVAYGESHGVPSPKFRMVHDELVFGVARRFADAMRLYGQMGYSFTVNDDFRGPIRYRYDWGLEWVPPPFGPRLGGPYSAFNMGFREEQRFFRSLSAQVGWQWQVVPNQSSALRVGIEFYDGFSPYGELYLVPENHWAFVVSYDW